MPKTPRLQKRSHRFFCRVRVPRDLREIVGRTEIVRALGTGDYREAVQRCRLASAEIDAELAEARRKLTPPVVLTEHAIRQMALLWFHRAERAADLADAQGGDVAEVLDDLRLDVSDYQDEKNPGTLVAAQVFADRVLEEAGAVLDVSSPEYDLLCRLIRRAMVEGARRSIDRLRGNHGARSHDAMFNGVRPDAPPPEAPGVTLGELVKRYMDDPARVGVTAKTRLDSDFAFKALTELLGAATPARDVTRADCRRVRDVLSKLPPNATKRFRGKKLERVATTAEARGLRPMAARTANAYLTKLSALFRWAEREEFVARNPAVGLKVAEPEANKRDARRPFTAEQLRLIFNAPMYTAPQNVVRRGKFWVPLLALFTGMRLSECCQLAIDDVTTRDGVPVILVRGGDGKKVKTAAARRMIPVHAELVRCGFLAYVEAQRSAGDVRLFPELKQDRRGYYSDPFQKWFSRFLNKAGAKRPRTSFHSLRHCFRDALREGDVSREAVLALGGWAGSGVADQIYGGGLRASSLAREIAKIRYPGLDLSHLHAG